MVAFQIVHGHRVVVTVTSAVVCQMRKSLERRESLEKKWGRNRFPVGSQCSCECSVYLPSVCLGMNISKYITYVCPAHTGNTSQPHSWLGRRYRCAASPPGLIDPAWNTPL